MTDNLMECHKLGLAITAYYCPRKVVEEQSAVVTANRLEIDVAEIATNRAVCENR